MDKACDTPLKSIFLGDFNLHMDKPEQWDSRKFALAIENLGFVQHVKEPTHGLHIIDLVISDGSDDLVQNVQVDTLALDCSRHHVIKFTLNCAKPSPLKISKSFREYGKLNHAHFTEVLNDKLDSFPDSHDPNILVESFNNLTSSTLNEMCPLVTKEVTLKHSLPWYNDTIHRARQERRRLERKWKKSRAEEDEDCLQKQKKLVGYRELRAIRRAA